MFFLRSVEEEDGEDANDEDGGCVALAFSYVIFVLVMTWSRNFGSRDQVPLLGKIDWAEALP